MLPSMLLKNNKNDKQFFFKNKNFKLLFFSPCFDKSKSFWT